MFKRMLIGLAMVALICLGLSPSPAHAAADYGTPNVCVGEQGSRTSFIRSCVRVNWSRQADNTGSRLEGFYATTPDGCLALEDGGRYNPVRPFWADPNDGRLDYQYNFGVEDCNFTKDLSNAGSDGGPMDFRYVALARVDQGTDHNVYIGWTLWPNGEYRVNYAFAAEV